MHCTEIRVAQIFNTYEKMMLPNDSLVVSNFTVQALKGKPLILYGDGSQACSLCYVNDLVEGLIRLVNWAHIVPINIGTPPLLEGSIRQP